MELTGLDFVSAICDESRFPKYPPPTKERYEEVRGKTSKLDAASTKVVIDYFKELQESEESRRREIESKAASIIGFTGIAASVIINAAPLLLGEKFSNFIINYIVIGLYVLMGMALIISIILAQKAIKVGLNRYMSPDPSDRLNISEKNMEAHNRELAGDIVLSYENNLGVINDKAVYVSGAQIWFRNCIALLFLLMSVLALNALVSPSPKNLPSQMVILTPTPIPTATATQTPTQTPTATPTETVLPSPTSLTTSTP